MRRLRGVKAVSFDVDGTLWDFDKVMRNALRQTLLELARHCAEAAALLSVKKMIDIRDRVHERLRGRVSDLVEIRNESFKQALIDVRFPNDALATHLSDVYFEHRWAGTELFGDVRPALEALARKYRLGILSNGNSYAEKIGLGDLVSFGVYAQDRGGIEKPDPRIFRMAAEAAGCLTHELVHVGDSLRDDIAGAKSAGVTNVWVNRNGAETDPGITPDFEVSNLRELVELL